MKGQINIANDELIFIKSPLKKKLKDKVRRFPILPIIALLLIYLFKINILKYGIPGLVFLCQRIIFETILNIKVIGSYLKIK